jgi:hypothetical protein
MQPLIANLVMSANKRRNVMSSNLQPIAVDSFDTSHLVSSVLLQCLQNRVTTLESQLQKALAHSQKKEAYANTLASDLEHIIVQLQRLDLVKK